MLVLAVAAFTRYRPKGVPGKGVGNSKNASEMRQKGAKTGFVLLEKEERSKMRLTCVKNAQNTFGGEHLLDDTDLLLEQSINIGERFLT